GAGGLLIVRFGILPILFIGGAASAGTNILFLMLADMGPNLQMLVVIHDHGSFQGEMGRGREGSFQGLPDL
ncbi:hypothetical protein PpSQ1_27150, partial [Pseudomonas putida]